MTGFYMECNTGLKWVKNNTVKNKNVFSLSKHNYPTYAMYTTVQFIISALIKQKIEPYPLSLVTSLFLRTTTPWLNLFQTIISLILGNVKPLPPLRDVPYYVSNYAYD